MWKMDSDQKSIPVVGFLTRNDCDVLRAKTGVYRRDTHRTIIPPTKSLSGFQPQSPQNSTTPSSSWQQGLTSNPSTALLGPSSVPHLSPNTPSGDSPQFNPYHTALETPTPTPNNPDAKLKPNMAVGHHKAILRKDFKKDPQINMIFEEIHSEFYLLVVTEHIFIESGDYKKKISPLVHHAFQ